MSEEEQTPPEETPWPRKDRRRERRVNYSVPCSFSIISPPWALTPEPLHGKTEDLSLHGARLFLEDLPVELGESWKEALDQDTELKVEIRLPDGEDIPLLKGQIVWLDTESPEEADMDPTGATALGILFSILPAKDQKRLLDLIGSLP